MTSAKAAAPRSSTEDATPLPPAGFEAWKGLLRSHATLVRRFDADLHASDGVSLGDFDVLAQLAIAPGGRRRMCDLAEAVVLSPSGLTRRVARLEMAGLVERRRSSEDQRSVEASLSPEGARLFERLREAHFTDIRRSFEERFSAEELDTLAELLGRLVAAEPSQG